MLTLKRFQSTLIAVRDEWIQDDTIPEIKTAEDINYGSCNLFAKEVDERLGLDMGIEVHWDNDSVPDGYGNPRKLYANDGYNGYGLHCFLKFQGKFYDSECIQGVDKWQMLPYYLRAFGPKGFQTDEERERGN